MKRRPIVTAVVAALALSASPALAASGIKPISPKKGDSVPVGKRPTFKMNVQGTGPVYVHVCKSKKQDADGLICSKESIGKAKKKAGSRREYKPKFVDFPEFWLNSPGTYYWQAHRISCEDGIDDCRLEGPTIKFTVG
jgi:hypothetical protein